MPSPLLPSVSSRQLGVVLTSARKARGWSQATLGHRIGLRQSRVSHLEQHPDELSVAQLLDWCAALGFELSLHERAPSPARGASGSSSTPEW